MGKACFKCNSAPILLSTAATFDFKVCPVKVAGRGRVIVVAAKDHRGHHRARDRYRSSDQNLVNTKVTQLRSSRPTESLLQMCRTHRSPDRLPSVSTDAASTRLMDRSGIPSISKVGEQVPVFPSLSTQSNHLCADIAAMGMVRALRP